MDRIETVALAGLGAVGSVYLARMSEYIPMDSIRVIASGERAERYRKNGVFVNGVTRHFPIYEPGASDRPADLALFAVKYHHLRQAIADARSQIGPQTVIISLLNGISSERDLIDAFGAERVLYALVMGLDATRTGDGTVSSTLGVIQFGEAVNKEGEYSRNVRLVRGFFDSAHVPYEILPDMKWALWKKFMLNVGANQTSAVLRVPYGEFQRHGAAREIATSAMEEVVMVASREGVNLTADDISDGLARLDRLSPDGKTSMLQDVEATRRTEVGIFGDTVVELGRRHGTPVPVNGLLSRLIHALEESYIQ
ncbi:MAG: 2-dehydropantoate 2-reductase [Synergistaceae bacterium]|jgi:2-dehydropantoate 2-reductase|nr:2-dehydropantoate 2-reductase [Synergistaceae bacterium]